jgi:hypothetical protein
MRRQTLLRNIIVRIGILAVLILAGKTGDCQNQENKGSQVSNEELVKKLNNPVGSLISAPIENNTDIGIGKYSGSRDLINFQPIVPIPLSATTNLIMRAVCPFVTQRNINSENATQTGLGDILASAFISPAVPKNGLIWGAGPVFSIPTATNDLLGTKKWSVGPTGALLVQSGRWTIGALVNQVWSVAGNKERPNVSQGFAEPFILYNWKSGAGINVVSEITRDWEGHSTTAKITPSLSGVTRFGSQIIQLKIGPNIHVAAPEGLKPAFGIQSTVTLIFPK